jgi:hypothetical protein
MSDRTGTTVPSLASDPSRGLEPRPVPPAMTRTGQETSWLLLAHLGPLGALPTAPRVARCLTRVILTTWGIGGLSDTAELIVSELTTNSIQATTAPGGRPRYDDQGRLPVMWLRLLSDRRRVLVEVWDLVPPMLGVPVAKHASPEDESGRGLLLVDSLSSCWGYEEVPGWPGKRTWVLI